MMGKLFKAVAYTVGFVTLGGVGLAVVTYLEHADFKPE